MPLPERHVFVCIANRPPGAGDSCGAGGARDLIERLQFGILDEGLSERVRVNGCTCLGPCEQGVNVVVYPEGVFYTRASAEDADEIVQRHLKGGEPVERLRYVEDH
ncbi:MAG: (2Fe-2S) ferredoxin domain-containing protein [Planctomycetota bacterium]|jgi:(2Fe-2S) ferredoxin|nr:(2Fe-2S) ferredoxin domain-containing protein [Planctomycetota bacterium]MDP6763521.1 (2Fe-2S) ferredoxin domain-containing protein [Planctomycetota bacterium]MDP6990792.1 (2Fe-2S) ferredoxin domain-containing protein [Planctomycetota bacterium]